MRRGGKAGTAAPTDARRPGRLAPCVLALGLLAGCTPAPAFDNDPLLGGRALPRAGAVAAAPKPAPTAPAALAPPAAVVTPASLAAGAPSDDGETLRIGPAPAAAASAPHDAGDPWHSAGPPVGATLKQPEPLPGGPPPPGVAVAPPAVGPVNAAVAPAGPSQYEQLQAMLAQRGVLFQSLEGPDDHDVWRFRCGVPSRGDPGSTHNYEASAAGEHGLAAVRAVIGQIDREQP